MPALGEAAHISGGDDNSIEGRAKRLWFELVQECTKRKIPVRKTPHGNGYLWNGSLQAMAIQVWPNLTRGGRVTAPVQAFIAEIRNHLKQHGNVIFEQTRGQMFISATYHQPKKKSTRKAVSPVLSVATKEMTVIEQARSVWAKARAHAEERKCELQEHEGVLFWKVEKPLAYFINAVFPDLHAYEGGRAPIYDFLRSTCNAVNISSDPTIDSEHAWLIRDTWNESSTVLIFRSVQPDRIDERAAKLTPQEAGEDREPAPVEVRHIEAQKKEEAMTETAPSEDPNIFMCPTCGTSFENQNALNGHRASHTPRMSKKQQAKQQQKQAKRRQGNSGAIGAGDHGFIVLDDGKVRCDECDATFDVAASIPGHKKQHYNERREAEIVRLDREVRRLRQQISSGDADLTPESALAVLETALRERSDSQTQIDTLTAQVRVLQEEAQTLRDEQAAHPDVTAFVELLQNIVDGVNSGTIAPIRGMADVDDLVRSMRSGG